MKLFAQATCNRCGQCCLRGGPVLMRRDAVLLEERSLLPQALVCLRPGEWVRDDVRRALYQQTEERLKLTGAGGGTHPWRCQHLRMREGSAECAAYLRRPAQCAALFCQDTASMEKLLAEDKPLSRSAALDALSRRLPPSAEIALWQEVVMAHEEQNPVRPALELAAALGFAPPGGDGEGRPPLDGIAHADAVKRLVLAVRTDAAFRELCTERAGIPTALLPFLLGRPLSALLAEVGLHPVDRS